MNTTQNLQRLLGVCAIAGAGVWSAACASQAPASEATAAPNAATLYASACAKCHAADGSGGLPMVANGPKPIDFRDAAWQASRSDEEIRLAIRDGRGAMPPFQDVLKPAEVAALARHVRTFGTEAK